MTTAGHDDPDRTELIAARPPVPGEGAAEGLAPGTRIGRYRIEGLLGRGGMGEVYRAEQLEPVRRTVALKLLRARRLDARHLAWFEVERQLLAQMRHPAIAQVYDADTTPGGNPYFAMEFIAGSPINRFCEERALPLRQRIELFVRVCEGVQHAHQKGVVHRDLKPGNLLVDEVDGRPLPKIIDFGIATAGAPGAGHEVAGTPDYMSPEQAGDDQALVDTRSDVYSLGVVLYELLTGQRPGAAGETVTDRSRTLRLPSQQLATLPPQDASRVARGHGVSVPDMRRLLRHELDWVVARAMRHDRNERYASAAALADDLRRFLEGRPVLAVPPTRRYVWGKFVRRHRVALAAAAVVLAALLSGLAVSVYGLMQAREQRAIAERRSAELEKVAAFQQSMLQGIDIEAMGLALSEGLRAQVAKRGEAHAAALEQALEAASTTDLARSLVDRNIVAGADQAIDASFGQEPALAADLRESVGHVRAALGLHEAAAETFAAVAESRARLFGAGDRRALEARRAQASSLAAAAQPAPALALAKQALEDAGQLGDGDALRLRLELVAAEATGALGDRAAARAALEALHARADTALGARDAVTLAVQDSLAGLMARMGEPAAGRDAMEQVVALRLEMLGPTHADTLAAQQTLATLRAMSGDLDSAIALQRQLVDVQTRRLGAEHPQTLTARGNLATMLVDDGAWEQALPIAIGVLEARARVLGADHPQTLRATLNLSTLYARLEQYERTLALQREVLDARTRLFGPRHPDTVFVLVNYAGTLHQAGHQQAALDVLERALPLAREVLGAAHPQAQAALQIRGDTAAALERWPLATASYRELLELRRAELGDSHRGTIGIAWELQRVLADAGQGAEAAALRSRYVEPLLTADPGTLAPDLRDLADGIREQEAGEA